MIWSMSLDWMEHSSRWSRTCRKKSDLWLNDTNLIKAMLLESKSIDFASLPHWLQTLGAMLLQPESYAFTVWNQCSDSLEWLHLQRGSNATFADSQYLWVLKRNWRQAWRGRAWREPWSVFRHEWAMPGPVMLLRWWTRAGKPLANGRLTWGGGHLQLRAGGAEDKEWLQTERSIERLITARIAF